jgi:hypothetical protein
LVENDRKWVINVLSDLSANHSTALTQYNTDVTLVGGSSVLGRRVRIT